MSILVFRISLFQRCDDLWSFQLYLISAIEYVRSPQDCLILLRWESVENYFIRHSLQLFFVISVAPTRALWNYSLAQFKNNCVVSFSYPHNMNNKTKNSKIKFNLSNLIKNMVTPIRILAILKIWYTYMCFYQYFKIFNMHIWVFTNKFKIASII